MSSPELTADVFTETEASLLPPNRPGRDRRARLCERSGQDPRPVTPRGPNCLKHTDCHDSLCRSVSFRPAVFQTHACSWSERCPPVRVCRPPGAALSAEVSISGGTEARPRDSAACEKCPLSATSKENLSSLDNFHFCRQHI